MSDSFPGTDQPAPVPAGWYPDPWDQTQHRWWNGTTWTAEVFPNGPATPQAPVVPTAPVAAAPVTPAPVTPAPVAPLIPEAGSTDAVAAAPDTELADRTLPVEPIQWTPPAADAPPPPPEWSSTKGWSTPYWEQPAAVQKTRRLPQGRTLAAIALAIGLIVGFGGAFAIGTALSDHSKSKVQAQPVPTVPATPIPTNPPFTAPQIPLNTAPTLPPDPSASALTKLVLQPADAPPPLIVGMVQGGDQVTDQPTLDLCNGTFPSESQRTSRLQVTAFDDQGSQLLSTEAVLYKAAGESAQAFTELRSVAAKCPSTPVPSPVGEPTVTTKFNASPDGAWPQTAGVERLAFDFTSTDDQGQSHHSIAVYLRRGHALLGVYFAQPDGAQRAIVGQTTVPGIVGVFAARLAQLPASVVNG